MKRIAIVGAGNAGCITALHYFNHGQDQFEIDIYHSPETHPIEKVGQGTVIPQALYICDSLGIDVNNNIIDATIKTGFQYEGWGKKNEKIFDKFFAPFEVGALHYVPEKLSKAILESGNYKVYEGVVEDPEKEIDADYIFDCRGKTGRDESNYEPLVATVNSVLLYNKPGKIDLDYTRGVATPNGWTFIIPNLDSVSYGYLYNRDITTKEDAIKDFLERFDLPSVDFDLDFDSYVAKEIFVGERTILNGNRCSFYEPLDATALFFYQEVAKYAWSHIVDGEDKKWCNDKLRKHMKEVETYILWRYRHGSIYDTPFWDHAMSLPWKPDKLFYECLENPKSLLTFGQWQAVVFQTWQKNIN
tara:strand:+ start:146 stop:1222 length:1077 start_codon:yes stop_codon:yes gene_type:complete